jgi:hypothetical protein
MHIKLNYIGPLFAAGAAAVAIAAAPIAAAAPTAGPGPAIEQSCSGTGSGTECQSPGNVQLDDSPPPVSYDPYGGEGFLLGGYGGYGHGGFGGGGFHGGGGGGHR